CQHFLDCINQGRTPLTSGEKGMELVRILEASSLSLKRGGAPVEFTAQAPARSLPVTNLAIQIQTPVHTNGNGHGNGNGNGHALRKNGKNGSARATALLAATR